MLNQIPNTANIADTQSSRRKIYTIAGITGLSSLIPLGILGKAGKDVFAKNGGKITSAIGTTIKKNPWTTLTAATLAVLGIQLASKDSVNSQLSLGDRTKAFSAGAGLSTVAMVPETGAAIAALGLGSATKKAFTANGRKVLPAIATVLKKNPITALAFVGMTIASFWLEKKSYDYQDKAISGKSQP